jgi:hypothetical protein
MVLVSRRPFPHQGVHEEPQLCTTVLRRSVTAHATLCRSTSMQCRHCEALLENV